MAEKLDRCKFFVVTYTGVIHQRVRANSVRVGRTLTIDDLPDDVLLAIFDFHEVKCHALVFPGFGGYETKRKIESWQSLVHVCRRWRCLVFGSPRRLNLKLCCVPGTSAKTSADVWPAFPLVILGGVSESSMDNAIARLEHSDRICQIQIDLNRYTTRIDELWTAMQVPFPELVILNLSYGDLSHGPAIPDPFLGGSVQRLRYLSLRSVSFPGLPKLLLSGAHLVHLSLLHVPHSGYISPDAMATCFPILTSLESFQLEFGYFQDYPDQQSRHPLPQIRTVLPALTRFWFKGVNQYFEDLVSRIDAPRLYRMSTTFLNYIAFDTPELRQFISRTPRFGAYDEARLIFYSREALVRLQSLPEPSDHGMVEVKVVCRVPNRQFSSLAQLCASPLRPLLTMEDLYIYENPYSPPDWKDDIELDLLRSFKAVKNLYLSKKFARRIAPALQGLTGARTIEVLPALQNVLLEKFRPTEPVLEGIAQFISARQLINQPVAISFWDR